MTHEPTSLCIIHVQAAYNPQTQSSTYHTDCSACEFLSQVSYADTMCINLILLLDVKSFLNYWSMLNVKLWQNI